MQSTPKPPQGAVERFLALGECTGIISDVMDELGIPAGVVGASMLQPTMPGKLIFGPALTVRNIAAARRSARGARRRTSTGWRSSRRTTWPRTATCW